MSLWWMCLRLFSFIRTIHQLLLFSYLNLWCCFKVKKKSITFYYPRYFNHFSRSIKQNKTKKFIKSQHFKTHTRPIPQKICHRKVSVFVENVWTKKYKHCDEETNKIIYIWTFLSLFYSRHHFDLVSEPRVSFMLLGCVRVLSVTYQAMSRSILIPTEKINKKQPNATWKLVTVTWVSQFASQQLTIWYFTCTHWSVQWGTSTLDLNKYIKYQFTKVSTLNSELSHSTNYFTAFSLFEFLILNSLCLLWTSGDMATCKQFYQTMAECS